MGCPHASACPLFPYLNASLGAWRVSYCDSANGWRGCARFILAGQGKPVPLALLPNGRLPVSMLPRVGRADSLDVAHDLRNDQPAEGSRTVVAAPSAGHADAPPTWAGQGLFAHPGPRKEHLSHAQHARSTPAASNPAKTQRDGSGAESVQQQDWTPTPTPSWWRRVWNWLGGPV